MKKKISIFTIIFLLVDLITKYVVESNLKLWQTIPIINNFFGITKVYNNGASWNILAGQQFVLILIAIIILAFLFKYQQKFILNKRNVLTFSLLYSGILGNLLNRIFNGYVIDFIDFKIFGYDFPVFNFADIWIVVGIFLLVIAILKKEDECGSSSKRDK